MAISFHQQQEQSPTSLLDSLYCEEEKWEVETLEEEEEEYESEERVEKNPSLFPIMLLEQDLFWEDEELISLFSKQGKCVKQGIFKDPYLRNARKEAVEWMLMVNAHFGFSTLTAVLSVDYLDRFLLSFKVDEDKPWTMQLAAVTCLSLAAKVEETYVPLLLDLQVEGTKYMFEAKNIQKMELLVLTTLEWKMNPVTPLSFLDHIIRRLGLKTLLHWEFLRRCERLLLSVLSDWRMVGYLPSELATATMLHVIDEIEPSNSLEYQNQLLGVLNITKEKVNDCYEMMMERWSRNGESNRGTKRKYEEMRNTISINDTTNNNYNIPSSPSGVIDAYLYDDLISSDTSNDSWATTTTTTTIYNTSNNNNNNAIIGLLSLSSSSLSSSSISSSPVRSGKKRMHEQPMPLKLPSLTRVFVDVIGSPR